MRGNKVKISVVVPVYNAETYIEDCIRALLSQNYPVDNYEIIMIDNNSKDGSPEIIKRYPGIKYQKRDKQGSYAARNRGILQATLHLLISKIYKYIKKSMYSINFPAAVIFSILRNTYNLK